ncbi:hypothetical protein ACFWAX_33220, partial [Streptomyces sp. NPDC059956]
MTTGPAVIQGLTDTLTAVQAQSARAGRGSWSGHAIGQGGVLGVVKVATAAQIRLLMCPGTADAATVRGGCKDLEAEGLVLSAGRTSRLEADGRRITEKLWSLTPSGLEAAAVVLDRPVREMGGTAKAAAASGAKHAGKVTDTLAALLRTPLETTAPVVRKNTVPA